MRQSRIRIREESSHVWYFALVRHYQPSTGFCVRVLVLTPGRRWLAELDHERVQEVGPYAAAVELLDAKLEEIPWFLGPGEIRVNNSTLAENLAEMARWHGFAIVIHEHESLEDARLKLQDCTEPRGVVVWL